MIIPKSDKPVDFKNTFNRQHPLLEKVRTNPHSEGRRPPMPVKAPKSKTP